MRLLLFLLGLTIVGSLSGEEPLYAKKGPEQKDFAWLPAIIQHVSPLKHERGDRLPLILWELGPFTPQPAETYRALLARGLTQHIRLDTNHIAIAQALQAAGSTVIIMQGDYTHGHAARHDLLAPAGAELLLAVFLKGCCQCTGRKDAPPDKTP